jgi:UDP-N-acetylmuramate--alanine ligase
MPNFVDFSGRPFHFIGIGGIGMSALAYVLAKRNLPVSGSDIRSSHITQRLEAIGAHIFGRQDASNLQLWHHLDPTCKATAAAIASTSGTNVLLAEPWNPISTLSGNKKQHTYLKSFVQLQLIRPIWSIELRLI